jgi:hypothetical protein
MEPIPKPEALMLSYAVQAACRRSIERKRDFILDGRMIFQIDLARVML